VCLVAEDAIFSGDTLFEGSCGRTDLPGGDWATILKSLKRLAQLEGDFRVYPGHGPSTTLEDEKKWNPYMRQ
jgi:glyoxylase-like metal-dependent hydrolase (beta-lactamase superfamily II)